MTCIWNPFVALSPEKMNVPCRRVYSTHVGVPAAPCHPGEGLLRRMQVHGASWNRGRASCPWILLHGVFHDHPSPASSVLIRTAAWGPWRSVLAQHLASLHRCPHRPRRPQMRSASGRQPRPAGPGNLGGFKHLIAACKIGLGFPLCHNFPPVSFSIAVNLTFLFLF